MSDEKLERLTTELWDRYNALLDRYWPKLSEQACGQELTAITEQLETALSQVNDPSLVRAKALRLLGDVYSDLAYANEGINLARAATSYAEALQLHERMDEPLERGKLAFNYANTIRRINSSDPWLLEEAQRQYQAARQVFEQMQPDLVPRVDEACQSLNVLMRVASLQQVIDRDTTGLSRIQQMINEGAKIGQIRAQMDSLMKETGGPSALVREVSAALQQLPASAASERTELETQLHAIKASVQDHDTSVKQSWEQKILAELQQQLHADVVSGKVCPERQQALEDIFRQIGALLTTEDESLTELAEKCNRLKELTQTMTYYTRTPSRGGLSLPPEGSRAAQVLTLLDLVRQGLFEDTLLPHRMINPLLLKSLNDLEHELIQAGADDHRVRRLEQERIWPFVVEVRQYLNRYRPAVIHPSWGVPKSSATRPDAITVVGGTETIKLCRERCEKQGLRLLMPLEGKGLAKERWDQLAEAAVVIVDFDSPRGGALLAAAGYEYGVAQVLGKPVVVVRSTNELPFDIDVTPTELNSSALRQALDEALYAARVDPANGLQSAKAAAAAHYGAGKPSIGECNILKNLESLQDDRNPQQVVAMLKALQENGRRGGILTFPRWPIAPIAHPAELFHVMPFGPDWADQTAAAVEAGCCSAFHYIRGDRMLSPDVIEDIWVSLSKSFAVVVDLTGLNPNVAVELGMVHALGRPTLLTTREEPQASVFPMIAKLRIHRYRDGEALEGLVRQWLTGLDHDPSELTESEPDSLLGPRPPRSLVDTGFIRQMIQTAISHEEQTHVLWKTLQNAAALNGQLITDQQLYRVLAFTIEYVEHVPLLMHQISVVSQGTPFERNMHHLLDVAVSYWREPNDIIPDRLGLLGILDDAYFTLCLLQTVSSHCQQQTGWPLFPIDLTGVNQQMRAVIGNPVADQLDYQIAQMLSLENLPGILGSLQNFLGSHSMDYSSAMSDPIWGNASPERIANVHLGAMGIM